ncbi:hypothetical protein L7F22_013572 [Adiantum nelumboides]|nr:hypothetical protein [Adiantum nelumboides]
MGNPALQGKVQQQLHSYGILPPFQQKRPPERSHGETSKKGLSMEKGVENPYQELKQLLEGKPSSKNKAHAPHDGSPSKEREVSKYQDESMEDVAPRKRRAQRSPTPQIERGLLMVLTIVSPKEKRRSPRRRTRERGHLLLSSHRPLPLLTKVAGIILKKSKGEDTKGHMLLGRVVDEPIEDVPILELSITLVHLPYFHLNGKDYILLHSIYSLFNIKEDYYRAAITKASQVAKVFVDIEGESKEEFLALDLETSNQKFLENPNAFDLCLKRVIEEEPALKDEDFEARLVELGIHKFGRNVIEPNEINFDMGAKVSFEHEGQIEVDELEKIELLGEDNFLGRAGDHTELRRAPTMEEEPPEEEEDESIVEEEEEGPQSQSPFSVLSEDLLHYAALGEIQLVGDFNART